MTRALVVAIAALSLGCAGAGVVAPPYTPQELEQRCTRDNGWWRPDVGTGYCERV
jgi:hypothetical protein